MAARNPVLSEELPYGLPPFGEITPAHVTSAIDAGMVAESADVDAIVRGSSAPTFENTVVALECSSGRAKLRRAKLVLRVLADANSTPEYEEVDRQVAPRIALHNDSIKFNDGLWRRVDSVFRHHIPEGTAATAVGIGLTATQTRLLRRVHTEFVREGAALDAENKRILGEINAALASLESSFPQKLRAERVARGVVCNDVTELEGFTDEEILSAQEAARSAGFPGKYVIQLVNTTPQPVLTKLRRHDVRERVLTASRQRNSSGGPNDTREDIIKIASLRAKKAELLGYKSWADYETELEMASNSHNVNDLISRVIPAALKQMQRETIENQSELDTDKGTNTPLAASDWEYYSNKVMQRKFQFSDEVLSQYFELESVLHNGLFYVAHELYGLTFRKRPDLPTYHPDVQVFEVFEDNNEAIALFLFDPFARDNKSGGAWMENIVPQSKLLRTKPIVYNCCNIPKPPPGKPVLVSLYWVNTMFHEFGHGLHGMLSNVDYPSISGISVGCDFAEFPSQLNEMWTLHPRVLSNMAKHHQTNEPIPQGLVDKVIESKRFNQGYLTCSYLAATVVDVAWHTTPPAQLPHTPEEVNAFETKALKDAGLLLELVPPRYHSCYFNHSFTEYSGRYYSYIWAEVLDATASEWILAHGGLTRENGRRLKDCVLQWGNSKDPNEQIESFLGGKPTVDALLRKRGFL
ncbi:dipeptidyl carboxypeptidase II [Pelomyxa schiedti]|nr:dipeptidyl carboxypeptidase II [Pelomyxa schiedti]